MPATFKIFRRMPSFPWSNAPKMQAVNQCGAATRQRSTKIGIAAVAAVVLGAGCTDDPYAPPTFPFATSYTGQPVMAPRVLDKKGWWLNFEDATLNALVETALQGSLSLDLARERVIEARAVRNSIPLAASVSPSARLQRERQGEDGSDLTRTEVTLGFEWLLDIYGGRRAQADAASARVAAADAEVDAARLLLLLNITNAYVDLRFQQTSQSLRWSELQSRRQTLELVETLMEADSATRIEVVRARALVSEIRAELPGIEATITRLKNQIAVLSGQTPGGATINLDNRTAQPRVSMSPQIGIPADLLRNRPDVRVAERTYYAALRDVRSSIAALYPQLSLGGVLSLVGLSGDQSTDYIFGPALRLPLLPTTGQRATVALRESRVRQAHMTWQLTVLEAIGDVESALGEYAASRQARSAAQETVRLYTEAVNLTRESVKQDGGTVRDLIDAEQNLSVANAGLANARRQLGRSYIALNVSLGAGSSYQAEEVIAAN